MDEDGQRYFPPPPPPPMKGYPPPPPPPPGMDDEESLPAPPPPPRTASMFESLPAVPPPPKSASMYSSAQEKILMDTVVLHQNKPTNPIQKGVVDGVRSGVEKSSLFLRQKDKNGEVILPQQAISGKPVFIPGKNAGNVQSGQVQLKTPAPPKKADKFQSVVVKEDVKSSAPSKKTDTFKSVVVKEDARTPAPSKKTDTFKSVVVKGDPAPSKKTDTFKSVEVREDVKTSAPPKTHDKFQSVTVKENVKEEIGFEATPNFSDFVAVPKPLEMTKEENLAISKEYDSVEEITASLYDQEIFDWLNRVRSDPASIIPYLEERLRKFQNGTKNLETGPAKYETTMEGADPVKEAIDFLAKQTSAAELMWSNSLANAAEHHVKETGPIGGFSHESSDGTGAHERILKYFPAAEGTAESIKYSSNNAKEVILSLIIDDGNASRGNRRNVFGKWDFVGCFTGPHKTQGTMTTINFVRSKTLSDNIIADAAAVAEKDIQDPPGWTKKQRIIEYSEDRLKLTYTYTFKDETTKDVSVEMDLAFF